VLSVDFAWYLDGYHGSDYFRRWHAYKNGGGSLWVHKARKHFDLDELVVSRRDPVEGAAPSVVSCRSTGRTATSRRTIAACVRTRRTAAFYYDLTTNPTRMKLYARFRERE
jgi:hypothetical protein